MHLYKGRQSIRLWMARQFKMFGFILKENESIVTTNVYEIHKSDTSMISDHNKHT